MNDTHKLVIAEIAGLNWSALDAEELLSVAMAYYYFSVQFRENLLEALQLYPDDAMLHSLVAGECDTDNLSPWPGVAQPQERMDHDEFMLRALALSPMPSDRREAVEKAGLAYLQRARQESPEVKARSIASYENGGLEVTFRAFLTAPDWNLPALRAFRHFLVEHIKFDSDPEEGHGALSRHLQVDDSILPLWSDFRDLLIFAAPQLAVSVAEMA